MEIERSFTAIRLSTDNINDNIEIRLNYGRIEGPYYDREYPQEEFDTEEEAIRYTYNTDRYARWLILPIIKFK